MKLYYYHDPLGNFGDDMNTWIWDALLPGFREWRDDTTLIGIGTILNTQLPLPAGRKMVMGSGTGYGFLPPLTPPEMWDIRAVRGPRSAERLQIAPEKGIVDPAMMLPRLPEFANIAKTGTQPIFIPHCSNDTRHDWDAVCGKLGIRYVTPRGQDRDVIREIAEAPLVLAESMHAAIVADAFRTPWIPISVSGTLNYPKWLDWSDSLGVELNVVELFPEFSAAISKVRGLKNSLTGKGKATASPSGQGAGRMGQGSGKGPAASGQGKMKKLQLQLRHTLEGVGIESRMKKAMQTTPSLSDTAQLNARQDAFQTMLDQTIAEYSTVPAALDA